MKTQGSEVTVNIDVKELLQSLSLRQLANRWGIDFAKSYMAKEFGLSDADVEAAATVLTYSDDFTIKSLDDKSLSADSVLVYDAICSTRSIDRDGDVIETAGLELDEKMPLLFAHAQNLCIGKHVQVVSKSDAQWTSRFSIADTALGRDCATLVKHGALRKSIGFMPTELEPRGIKEDSSGSKYATGWHIKKAKVFETSLVAIPANSDTRVLAIYEKEFSGICTAFSRDELKHDGLKRWAKSLYEKRPTQVQGADMTKDTMGGELPAETYEECPMCHEKAMDSTGTCTKCGHVKGKSVGELETKDTTVAATKGLSHYPKGSFEHVQSDLDRSARKYLRSKGKIDEDDYGWTSLYATFDSKAVVCMYEGEGKYKCYSIAYKMENGMAQWDGEPTEVDVEPAIISKRFESLISIKSVEIKEVVKEVKVEVVKEHTLDELRKMFVAKAVVSGVEGYKAVKEVAELHEAANYTRTATELFN